MVKKKTKSTKRASLSRTSRGERADVAGDERDNGDDLLLDTISASEDEETSADERKHSKLLEAISALRGKRRNKGAERTEASLLISEFGVNAEGAGDKVALSDLLGSVAEASKNEGNLTKTHKKLTNLEKSQATLELPLSQQQADKVQREAAFVKASKDVSRWETTIHHQQRAEQLTFPLQQPSATPKRVEQLVTHWKAQTPLEQEVFALLHAHKQPTVDPVLTVVEEAQLQAMSLEEAKIRRAELQKARALQSYYEAKAKRERKIKSKKYHKVQQKVKRKAFLMQFEEMCKSNPEQALEELQKMEKGRIEERMSLKHQNTGKWAKSKAIMGKYDHGARQALQEQLELNRQLTQKPLSSELHDHSHHSEELNTDSNVEETLPDIVNDASVNQKEGANPWMRVAVVMPPEVNTTPSDLPQMGEGDEVQIVEEETNEEEETEEEKLLQKFAHRRLQRKNNDGEEAFKTTELLDHAGEEDSSMMIALRKEKEAEREENSEEEEEDMINEAAASELSALFGRLTKQGKRTVVPAPTNSGVSMEILLDEGLTPALEDVEHLVEMQSDIGSVVEADNAALQENKDERAPKAKGTQTVIDLKQVLTKQASSIRVPMAPITVEDAEDETLDEQTNMIQEAFAGDDVISDFLKEKRKQEVEAQPKDVNPSLPGWGEWGGTNIKIKKSKYRRFLKKAPPPAPRKDGKLPSVIISEKRDVSVAAHQVTQLPFPFENPAQFECNIRNPIGSTWNPELVVRKLTAPRIVTQAGAIIDPMSKDQILSKKGGPEKRKAPDIILDQMEKRRKHTGSKKKKHKK